MIRAAGVRDLDTMESIEQASFGSDAWSPAALRDEIGGEHLVLVEVDEFGVRGYASVRLFAPDAELLRIAVGLGSRRQGVARELLIAIEELVVNRGADRLLLEVADDNEAALALYRLRGFRASGRRPSYYRSGADAILMDRPLT